MTISNVPIHIM